MRTFNKTFLFLTFIVFLLTIVKADLIQAHSYSGKKGTKKHHHLSTQKIQDLIKQLNDLVNFAKRHQQHQDCSSSESESSQSKSQGITFLVKSISNHKAEDSDSTESESNIERGIIELDKKDIKFLTDVKKKQTVSKENVQNHDKSESKPIKHEQLVPKSKEDRIQKKEQYIMQAKVNNQSFMILKSQQQKQVQQIKNQNDQHHKLTNNSSSQENESKNISLPNSPKEQQNKLRVTNDLKQQPHPNRSEGQKHQKMETDSNSVHKPLESHIDSDINHPEKKQVDYHIQRPQVQINSTQILVNSSVQQNQKNINTEQTKINKIQVHQDNKNHQNNIISSDLPHETINQINNQVNSSTSTQTEVGKVEENKNTLKQDQTQSAEKQSNNLSMISTQNIQIKHEENLNLPNIPIDPKVHSIDVQSQNSKVSLGQQNSQETEIKKSTIITEQTHQSSINEPQKQISPPSNTSSSQKDQILNKNSSSIEIIQNNVNQSDESNNLQKENSNAHIIENNSQSILPQQNQQESSSNVLPTNETQLQSNQVVSSNYSSQAQQQNQQVVSKMSNHQYLISQFPEVSSQELATEQNTNTDKKQSQNSWINLASTPQTIQTSVSAQNHVFSTLNQPKQDINQEKNLQELQKNL